MFLQLFTNNRSPTLLATFSMSSLLIFPISRFAFLQVFEMRCSHLKIPVAFFSAWETFLKFSTKVKAQFSIKSRFRLRAID